MVRSAAFLLVAIAASARADDLAPPPWRFNPGTTVQHWDFTAGPAGGAPDAGPLFNPYGNPTLSPGFGATWLAAASGRQEVWSMPGIGWLSFAIPNTGNTQHQKEVWLQVTYLTLTPPGGPLYMVSSPSTGLFTRISTQVTLLPDGWTHELTRWSSATCPPSERVDIAPVWTGGGGPSILIDQVVIDTQCIPAPSAAVIAALATVVCARRRRAVAPGSSR